MVGRTPPSARVPLDPLFAGANQSRANQSRANQSRDRKGATNLTRI
jgi:hypothetical protein